MPYRRLPNTDQARLRSLKSALAAIELYSPSDLLFSQKTAMDVRAFTTVFEQAVNQYVDSRNLQAQLGKKMNEAGKNARLYLSHFIQVFNMCILRGEIKKEARKILGLDHTKGTVPEMITDTQLIELGRNVIDGESKRSGNRIYNPSIANVKVKMDLFSEIYAKHKDIQLTIQKHHAKLDEIRSKADQIILNVWNEVEESLGVVDTDEKREKAREYGVVYFYRPIERHKDFLAGK
ncbi:MAG: hypothetical protein MJZ15_01375 [Bacteroidales bacterium]|nr:hypothetical protein [Bacteroidales bacterium]